MLLFGRVPDHLEKVFIDTLDKRVGGEVIKPLFSHFGSDLYLILSVLNGTYKHFPSLKVLKSLLLQCDIYFRVNKKKEEGIELERAVEEIAYDLGISSRKVSVLYERFYKQIEA